MSTKIIAVAYSMSTKNGRNYHARAYCEERDFPGLPKTSVYRFGIAVGNNPESAKEAINEAINKIVKQYPDYADCEVLCYGRMNETLLSGAPVFAFQGRAKLMGNASGVISK